MPKFDFNLLTITQTLENDSYLAEALFYREVSRFGDDLDRIHYSLEANAARILEKAAPMEIYRRQGPRDPVIKEVRLDLDGPPRSVGWRSPITLVFHLVCWDHGEDAQVCFVPALGIEVVAKSSADLEQLAVGQIRAHLLRINAATSLAHLVWLQRCRSLNIERLPFVATIRSPKQIAASVQEDKPRKPVLEEVGIDLTRQPLPESFEISGLVARIAEAISGRKPKSVLLVGKSGVGKTAAVYELVRQRHLFQLDRTPFWATSGSRLVAGMSGFGMWQERCQRLWRESAKAKAILHLGNLVELMEVGKSVSNSQGIASFFRPYLLRGDLLAITEATPEQLPVIEREDPHLLEAFHRIHVEEPSVETGKAILLSCAARQGDRSGAQIDFEGISTLDRLHRRYATYSAYPGRPLRFLRNILQDANERPALSARDVIAAFSEETGLPLFMLDDSVQLDLGGDHRWFSERVIGQMEAVDLIVNLLATVKAGLTRPRKPIASLLFIGPTGVGKTEMAKSLAEFLFRDRNRLARFDMSEYADPVSVKRLIGGVFGSEGLLTARVREQPFSVILLDEFEKADPSFFDLLLQVLGEGRLTDAGGRLADFCNSVIVMTSNLGAESFQKNKIGLSADESERSQAARHFVKEVRAFVRPELFNRIDRIVPFAPLDQSTVLNITKRELEVLNERDGVRFQGVTLVISDQVAGYLSRKGYDPRYGARPLKRVIERELLVPLAEGLNRRAAGAVCLAEVRVDRGRLHVSVHSKLDEHGRPVSVLAADASLFELAARSAKLRRDVQSLERCPAVREIENEIFRLERLAKLMTRRRWKRTEDLERLGRLPRLKEAAVAIESLSEKTYSLEDEIALAIYAKHEFDKSGFASAIAGASEEWDDLLLSVYSLRFNKPDYVTLAAYGENLKWLFEAASAYFRVAVEAGFHVKVFEFSVDQSGAGKGQKEADKSLEMLGRNVTKKKIEGAREFFDRPREGVVGIALGIEGPMAYPRYEPEQGLHAILEERRTERLLVHTSDAPVADYKPPGGIERRGAIAHQEKRRTYNSNESFAEDMILKKRFAWPGRSIDEVLARAIEERLIKDAKSLIEPEPPPSAD
jgi:ATP-dependent Clp protease ATP-binding subunit ClpC